MAIRISQYFTLDEMIASKTAKEKGIDNLPNLEQCCNMAIMCNRYLDIIREEWGSAVLITSGFRGFEYELGSPTSVHPDGWAADMVPANGKIAEFKVFVRDLLHRRKMLYDQFIDETRGKSKWVHLGIFNKKGQQRMQDLITTDGVHYQFMKAL